MPRAVAPLLALLVSINCQAQLTPLFRSVPEPADQTMMINDRGAEVELLPTLRATRVAEPSGERLTHQVFRATTPFSSTSLGVVFNHAMQVRGFITGEIAFKMKGATFPSATFDSASYPGLTKLSNVNVYTVVGRTPAEFLALFNRLQARADVEWVEPFIVYGSSTEDRTLSR